jgi:serine/threonine-protein kinase RsbW
MSSSQPPTERTIRASLPSALGIYNEFIDSILAHLADLNWSHGDMFAVQMALEESISNAIRHGNKEDARKKVDVTCQVSSTRFWIEICDEGDGFRPCDVPDCCAPDRLEIPGGRGLALIKAYMTCVEYNDRGNCLTMEKLPDATPGQSCSCC